MPDDNYIVTYTIKLNAGNTSDATAAGKQWGDAFAAGFKPNLTIRPEMVEKSAKDSAKVFSDVYKTSLTHALEDALKYVGPKGFPTQQTQPSAQQPALREQSAELAKNVQPFLSGVEALSLLLRGAPITSVAQMAGQAFRDFAEIRRGAGAVLTGGRPGESREAAIARRLEGAGAAPVAAAEAAASGAGGAAGVIATVAALAKHPLALVAAGIAVSGYEAAKATAELGRQGSETTIRWDNMAKTMGLTSEQFAKVQVDFARGGVNVEDFNRALTRLAVTSKKEMPEIARKIADSANVWEEADIKVADAERAVIKTHLDRQAASENVSKAEGEVVKVQLTGADVREQQARAAQLSVSGAQLGLRAAQVQTQFAPEDQRLADIRGTLGVAGARLNVQGADLSVQAAQARLAEVASGQREDPEAARARQIQQATHGLAAAELNARQARLRVQEAKEAEEKRHALPGPEEQAAQAEQQARLHVDQTTTAQQQLEVNQQYNTLRMQENEVIRKRVEAGITEEAAPDRQEQARIARERARKERDLLQYTEIPSVQLELQKLSRGEPVSEGYDIAQVPANVRREAILGISGGGVGSTVDFLKKLIPGMQDRTEQLETVGSIFQGRGIAGNQLQQLTSVFAEPEKPRTPEQETLVKRITASLGHDRVEEAKRAEEMFGTFDLSQRQAKLETEQAAMGRPSQMALPILDNTIVESVKQGALTLAGGLGDAGAAAIEFANKVQAIVLPSPKTAETPPAATAPAGGGGGGAATEVTEDHAEGGSVTGLISGPGSETSDSIPINASRDEFIVKAERVRELGVPFLNDLNEGRIGFQTGGVVSETGEQKRKRLAREAQAKYLKSIGYQAPGAYHPKLEGYGGDDSKASKLTLADRIALASGVAPPTEVTPENMRKFFGGFANAEQVRQAARSRKPDFDVPDSKAQAERRKNLEAAGLGYLMPKAGMSAQDYLKRLRSGETPESIRLDDAAARERATMIRKENPFFGKTPEEAGAIRVPGLIYAPDAPKPDLTPLPPPKPDEIKPDVFMPVPEPPPPEPDASFAERFDAGNFAAGGLVGRRRMQSGGSVEGSYYAGSQGAEAAVQRGLSGASSDPALAARIMERAGVVNPSLLQAGQQRLLQVQQIVHGYASGGLISGFTDHIRSMPGYAEGGVVAAKTGGGNTLSYHQLDIRTNAGNFRAGVSEDTMDGLRNSSLGSKMTQTAPMPSWYS